MGIFIESYFIDSFLRKVEDAAVLYPFGEKNSIKSSFSPSPILSTLSFLLDLGVTFSTVKGFASIAIALQPNLIASSDADASFAPHSIRVNISITLNNLKNSRSKL